MTSLGGRVSGSDVALSGASVPCGAWWVLAGNAGVAALLPGGAVETGSGVSVGSAPCVGGLEGGAAASVVAGTVATAPLDVAACSPQARSAVRITKSIHWDILNMQESFLSVPSGRDREIRTLECTRAVP